MVDLNVVPLHVADVTVAASDGAGHTHVPIVAHAVTHRDGVFLFDTGIGTGIAQIDEYFSPRRQPLEDALAAHGITMADVTGVANCHLHFDHSGQNALFPGRPIYAQEREWRMVHEPDYTVPEWVDLPGLRYEFVYGEAEIAPGLRLIPTPGHTAGQQSLVVETATGAIVLAGQAVWTRAEWEGATGADASGEPTAEDRYAYVRSVDRLRALGPARVHFAHDAAIWERAD